VARLRADGRGTPSGTAEGTLLERLGVGWAAAGGRGADRRPRAHEVRDGSGTSGSWPEPTGTRPRRRGRGSTCAGRARRYLLGWWCSRGHRSGWRRGGHGGQLRGALLTRAVPANVKSAFELPVTWLTFAPYAEIAGSAETWCGQGRIPILGGITSTLVGDANAEENGLGRLTVGGGYNAADRDRPASRALPRAREPPEGRPAPSRARLLRLSGALFA